MFPSLLENNWVQGFVRQIELFYNNDCHIMILQYNVCVTQKRFISFHVFFFFEYLFHGEKSF